MKKYLLDTNICIFFIKGLYSLNKKIAEAGEYNCFISEITVAELKYGVENSKTIESMRLVIDAFIPKFAIIPIYNSLDIYAKEKVKLRKQGLLIDDFDILIGATAMANNMIMVTNNTTHFNRLENIVIEDWTALQEK
ncbi:MAG: type II toxin-antitoxin system VapC family toxin [Ginsengibacter sp.]